MPTRSSPLFRVLAASVLCALGPTGTAYAQVDDDERARGHFEAGRSYYEQARYEESAREFEEAYRLSPRSPMLLNMSQAFERAGNLERAVEVLDEYLRLPDVTDRVTIESRRDSLRRHMESQVASAAELAPQAPGGTGTSGTGGGGIHDLGLTGIIFGGVGVGALVAGLVTGAVSDGIYTDLQARCPGDVCLDDARADVDEGRGLAVASTVLVPVSAALIATGIVLLVVDLTSSESDTQARIRGGPGEVGITLELASR